MCGISGIVVPPDEQPKRAVLQAMNNTLRRRGPDDEGYYIDAAGGCGLGHRRLSIIDVHGGHQPLASADGQIQTVVNGELYNFRALRSELQQLGYQFRTQSDSEVIVHGYDAWGLQVLARLDGMFALALWDARLRRLVLARDRIGKKPLYYAFVGQRRDTLIFGSELKALAAHPDLDRRVGVTQLAAYLTYEACPETDTIYDSAQKLLPATALVFDRERGRATHLTYWTLGFSGEPGVQDISGWTEPQVVDRLRELIRKATQARLMADVPLGVFLSGGLDSSIVTAAMRESVPASQIKTFSVTFDDRSFDEGQYARRVARHLGTDHHEERLRPAVMFEILPEIADFMCEPIGDASLIPTYLLARFTRESVTVALGGDGGDELFLGYPTFQAERMARFLDIALGQSGAQHLSQALGQLARALPVSYKNFSFDFKLRRFAQGLSWSPELRHQAWMGSFMPAELERLFNPDLWPRVRQRHPYALIAGLPPPLGPRLPLNRLIYQYLRLYLAACVLVKVDRASMACGLEVRAPLLDRAVVEFASAIPPPLKMKGYTTKHLLKRVAEPWLPRDIIERPKKGFGMPVAEWLRGPLKPLSHALLDPGRIAREGYFNPIEVTRLLQEHERGVADHRKPLWTLLAFQLWLERYGPEGSHQPTFDAA